MKKRICYHIGISNPLLWLSVVLLVLSASCRIALVCAGKDTGASAIWQQLILFCGAALAYAVILPTCAKERIYRISIPALFLGIYCGLRLTLFFRLWYIAVPCWLVLAFCVILFGNVVNGKTKHRWYIILPLGLCAAAFGLLAFFTQRNPLLTVYWLADALVFAGIFFSLLALRPYRDEAYHKMWGDRSDGRRIRSLPPITYVANYIMTTRNGAANNIRSTVEITDLERFIHEKRREGYPGLGMTHIFLAAYVRCVAQYPAINRFIAGQKIYSRDEDIQFCMVVKKEMSADAPESIIKLHLNPSDTLQTVYEKFNRAVEEVKSTPLDSEFDRTAQVLNLIPGVVMKFVVWLLKLLDYFGLIIAPLLEVSPFHGSVFFTSLGSLGIPPVVHHLYDFGNLPVFCAFGCKRKELEKNDAGEIVQRKYIDYTFNIDERTTDGFYFASVLKYFAKNMQHPERLELPPEEVKRDVD